MILPNTKVTYHSQKYTSVNERSTRRKQLQCTVNKTKNADTKIGKA